MIKYVNIVLLIILLALVAWNFYRAHVLKKASKKVDNQEFQDNISRGQLVDIRESSDYRRKHILGARNIPASQFKNSLAALNKNKPVLLYEAGKPQQALNIVSILNKAGFKDIYLLKNGLNEWTGKVKEGE
ncbi:rhodanese-like domain-containing protein [Streptococcaceae bacterium ESL0687]|nr:rhodanese-like domain-containing protein [Streptococcaceae bacterium ESL0687]